MFYFLLIMLCKFINKKYIISHDMRKIWCRKGEEEPTKKKKKKDILLEEKMIHF